jgi:hypothetical protein
MFNIKKYNNAENLLPHFLETHQNIECALKFIKRKLALHMTFSSYERKRLTFNFRLYNRDNICKSNCKNQQSITYIKTTSFKTL